MANGTRVTTVFQFRRDTTANWLANKDVIPAAGEPCFDLNLHTLKIGDGSTTYENLPAIGGVELKIEADGKSVVLEDNVFKLMGFDAAKVGAQPRKGEDGKLEWVVPSTETVDGLQSAVAGLQSNVTSLQTSVVNLQKLVGTSENGTAPLLTRIESLETQVSGTDALIDAKIEAFATTLTDDGKVNTLMELINYVIDHGEEAANLAAGIAELKGLVGLTSVAEQIANAGHMTKVEAESTLLSKVEAAKVLKRIKYEITSKPEGTLVDYRDKEIRVMVPSDYKWTKQNVGANGNANMYYMGFKAYAPEGAVSFKEGDHGVIVDEMFTFDDDFAGIDEFGRKYSICWLALASYNAVSDTWKYFGENSSFSKYVGWDYVVEWYDKNGVKIDADCIRINLSNENCHNVIEPYYMANVVKEVSVGGTILDVINNKVTIPVGAGLKFSDELNVSDDGIVSIGAVSWSKIVQAEGDVVTFDGGGAAG